MRFHAAVQHLTAAGYDTFIELSPHPILLHAIERNGGPASEAAANHQLMVASLRRGEGERLTLLHGLGALYAEGWPVRWAALHPSGGRCVRLPSYPWQREHFWLEQAEIEVPQANDRPPVQPGRIPAGDLLGQHLQSSAHLATHFWEGEISLESHPYLADHRVDGTAVLPATAYLDMALSAAIQAFGPGQHTIERVLLTEALALPAAATRTVQVVISPGLPGVDGTVPTASFQVAARPSGDATRGTRWTQHASGVIRGALADREELAPRRERPEAVQARCSEVASGPEHYRALTAHGLQYGPHFQGVAEVWRGELEAIARLRLPQDAPTPADSRAARVALLDACLQVLEAALCGPADSEERANAFLPVGLDRLAVFSPLDASSELWAHAVLAGEPDVVGDTATGDVYLVAADGQVVAEVRGLRMQSLQRRREPSVEALLHEIQWQPQERTLSEPAAASEVSGQKGSWLVFADASGVGEALATRLAQRGEIVGLVFPGGDFGVKGPELYGLNPAEPDHFRRLLEEFSSSTGASWRGVVHLWSLETRPTTLARSVGML